MRLDIRRRIELLTPRENEMLRYVITGMLNKQIALKLGIAEKPSRYTGAASWRSFTQIQWQNSSALPKSRHQVPGLGKK